MATIALVACVKDKQSKVCQAKDMYLGNDFRKWMDYAETNAEHIYILSGKYGILKLTDSIEPYDVNLNQKDSEYRQEWSNNILSFLEEQHELEKDKFLVITNPIYAEYLLPRFSNWEMPFTID